MKSINIPVSRFVHKILLTENDYIEPITYSRRNDDLFLNLSCAQEGARHKGKGLEKLLCQVISFRLQDWLALRIERNTYATGWILHRVYRRQLNEHIAKRADVMGGVLPAIYEFCDHYDIEVDVDISLDAITRSWRRYNTSRKTGILEKKKRQVVRLNSTKTGKRKVVMLLPRTDEELDEIVQTYAATNAAYFINTDRKPYIKRMSQLRCWVYRNIGYRTGAYCATKFKMKEKTVYRQTYSFTDLLQTLPPIQ